MIKLEHTIVRRREAEEQLKQAHDELETRVLQRTAELARANDSLTEEINERRRVEDSLRAAKKIWEQTFDAISDGVIVHDHFHRIVRCNVRAAEMLGVSGPAQAIGLTCSEACARVFGEHATSYELKHGLGTATSFETEGTDGRRYLVATSPLDALTGQPGWNVVTWSDVTELAGMHEQLARARRLAVIGQLAAGVAHEINNPLASLIACAEIVLRSMPEIAKLAESREWPFYLEEIVRQALRCKATARGLLDLSSQRRSQPAVCEVNAVAAECARLAKTRAEAAGIEVAVEIDPSVGEVVTDEKMLRQVLDNLLGNALDASSEGGQVTVSTTCDGQRLTMEVADTGHGMQAEVLARVFEPFFTTKELGKGAGLGLAVSAMLAEALEGEIAAESQPGVGSRFRLSIPHRVAEEAHGRKDVSIV